MKTVRKITVIVVVWGILLAAFLEIVLRLTADQLPPRLAIGAQAVMTGKPFTFDHLTTVSRYDIDHFVVLNPNLDLEMSASSGVRFHVVTHPLWEGTIGFRTRPVDYFVDAVVVGDSFAFCFTEYVDCWVTHLETIIGSGWVNLAQPGTGSVSHWRILDTYARPMHPPLVIWQFFGNDFYEDYQLAVWRGEVEEITVERPPLPSHHRANPLISWLRQHSVAFAVIEIALFDESAYLADSERAFVGAYLVHYRDGTLDFGQPYELEVLNINDPRIQLGLPYTRQALNDAQAAVTEWGGQLVILIMPTREEVYAHLTAPIMGQAALDKISSSRQAMADLCEELGLRCYDPLADLQDYARQGEHLFYTDDLHLNPHGNAVFAELVAAWLQANDLLP